jgi:hypothetical protein
MSNKDRINEVLSIALGVVSVLAIIGLLVKNNFATNELLGSIVNFTQVAIPVLVLIAMRIFNNRSYTYLDAGKNALVKLQHKYPDILDGPKANSQKSEDNEDLEKRNKYLFIKNKKDKFKNKITFIPMNELEDGILEIRVSKATLVNLNMLGTNEEIEAFQEKVSNAVIECLNTNKVNSKLYIIIPRENKSNSAIKIDFVQQDLGRRKFERIVTGCGDAALKVIT